MEKVHDGSGEGIVAVPGDHVGRASHVYDGGLRYGCLEMRPHLPG